MARKLRVEYPGAIYHVLNRGDRRAPIFKDAPDRTAFLEALAAVCAKTNWQVHAYVLMPNHFHLVVETPQPNLVAGMKWFLGTYTGRFNRRHKLSGHLFSGRYKSLLIDGSGSCYLKTVGDYVHLNPARARLLKRAQPLTAFAWSSWPAYLAAPSKRPPWLRVDRLLGEHGIPKDSPAGRRELESRVEAQRRAEDSDDYKPVRRGWCLGSDEFREELLAKLSERMGAEHYGEARAESDVAKAERIVKAELKRRQWTKADLKKRAKGEAGKVRIARRLRAETVMTVAWIAERLHLGSRNYANQLLARAPK